MAIMIWLFLHIPSNNTSYVYNFLICFRNQVIDYVHRFCRSFALDEAVVITFHDVHFILIGYLQ